MQIKPNPILAIAFMVAASVFIAATMLLAKALGTDALGAPLHPLQVAHGRFLFAFLGVGVIVGAMRPHLSAKNLRLHAVRSAFGATGVSLMFAAAALIPLSDATAISFLNPVFAMVFAVIFLAERVGPVRWAAAAIALLGAMILTRPGAGSFSPAALLALAAALAFGIEITVIKLLSARESPLPLLFINNSIGLVLSTLAVLAFWAPPSLAQWAALAALGLLMAGAQACYVNALARAESSLVVPFSYLTLVFAAAYDFAIFRAVPDVTSLVGAVVILLGAALLALREARHLRRSRAAKGVDDAAPRP